MPLTQGKIESAKPKEKPHRLTDGGGLVLTILPTGKKVWRFRYQRNGKDAVVSLGDYPTLRLLDAREKALDLKRQQVVGIDPAVARKRALEQQRTVAALDT